VRYAADHYQDYAPYLNEKREDALPVKAFHVAHTRAL